MKFDYDGYDGNGYSNRFNSFSGDEKRNVRNEEKKELFELTLRHDGGKNRNLFRKILMNEVLEMNFHHLSSLSSP